MMIIVLTRLLIEQAVFWATVIKAGSQAMHGNTAGAVTALVIGLIVHSLVKPDKGQREQYAKFQAQRKGAMR